jgi:hypothetical protein
MISAGGTTSWSPSASASDTGIQTPELRPNTEGAPGAAGPEFAL